MNFEGENMVYKRRNVLILRERKDDYFLPYIKNIDIHNIYKSSTKNIKIIFKVCKKLKLKAINMFFDEWKKHIKDYDTIIIFDNGYIESIAEYIKSKNSNCKIILYFWNPINPNNIHILKDTNTDEFWSFDKKNAKKYKLLYNPQFYTNQIKLNEVEKENDVLFLGRAKNRKRIIEEIDNKMKQEGISTKFYIIEKDKNLIDYQEYLKMIEKSKCILDIVNEGQNGLTLRCMEALFLKRKLITNNKEIKNYDFYNSNNVFIVGENNIENIKEFVDGKYIDIPVDIVNKYDFKTWLDNFKKE